MGVKKLVWRLLIIATWIFSGSLILACFDYQYTIPYFPVFEVVSIVVPWLVLGNLIGIILWILLKRWMLLPPLVALLIAFYSFGSLYEFGSVNNSEIGQSLGVMTFNVRSFSERHFGKSNRMGDEIVSFISKTSPDILCIQEFSRNRAKDFNQYPYKYITPTYQGKSTQVIMSKYPIVDMGQVAFPDSRNNTIFVDINYLGDTLRIYNVHLQSYNIGSRRFLYRNFGLDLIKRLKYVAKKHRQQAELLREHRKASPYPSLICGDFNSTPFSHTYSTLKGGMQDSFREQGRGWGTTFYLSSQFPFRIDYILADDSFEILAHKNYEVRLSDHLPVMAILKPKGQ